MVCLPPDTPQSQESCLKVCLKKQPEKIVLLKEGVLEFLRTQTQKFDTLDSIKKEEVGWIPPKVKSENSGIF